MQTRRQVIAASGAAAIMAVWPRMSLAAPKAELWPRWQAHDPASTAVVDHAIWARILAAHLRAQPDGINRLAYGQVSPIERAALAEYVAALAAAPVSRLSRPEQRALWINLYNALTVKIVLAHYPVNSIRAINISPGLFAIGPWGRKLISVEGEEISLDDIEHRILRPIWRDPRLHYAVSCASIGCPNLAAEPYTAANAERLLNQGAFAYVNHPRGVRIERRGLVVSSIYAWFKEDFGGDDSGVIAHLRQYAAPPLAGALADATRIADDAYDWALNDATCDQSTCSNSAFR